LSFEILYTGFKFNDAHEDTHRRKPVYMWSLYEILCVGGLWKAFWFLVFYTGAGYYLHAKCTKCNAPVHGMLAHMSLTRYRTCEHNYLRSLFLMRLSTFCCQPHQYIYWRDSEKGFGFDIKFTRERLLYLYYVLLQFSKKKKNSHKFLQRSYVTYNCITLHY